MNWGDFIKYLTFAYLAYYGINLLIDLLKPSKGQAIKGEEDVLHFEENINTTAVDDDPAYLVQTEKVEESWLQDDGDTEEIEVLQENINTSTGGVSKLEDIYRLAQEDAIEYSKNLVFS